MKLRYVPMRWTEQDQEYNDNSGETYGPVYCVVCYGMCGDYLVGQIIIADAVTHFTMHVSCAPRRVYWWGLLTLLVCTFRMITGTRNA